LNTHERNELTGFLSEKPPLLPLVVVVVVELLVECF
jgi:hypothetical protein